MSDACMRIQESNPGPSCCETPVLTTPPPPVHLNFVISPVLKGLQCLVDTGLLYIPWRLCSFPWNSWWDPNRLPPSPHSRCSAVINSAPARAGNYLSQKKFSFHSTDIQFPLNPLCQKEMMHLQDIWTSEWVKMLSSLFQFCETV